MAKKPTVYDVAKLSGVSIATVSRSIHKPESVSELTRQMVKLAIEQLGYVPSGSASSLAAQRTGSLGLFLPNIDAVENLEDFELVNHDAVEVLTDRQVNETYDEDSLYFDQVLRGCELEAWRQGMSLIVNIGFGRSESDVGKLVSDMAGKVDGLIILARSVPDRILEFLNRRMPMVLVADMPSNSEKKFDLVRVSNRKGMNALVTRLAEAQHVRHFAYLAGPDDSPDNRKRYEGFREGLSEHNINPASAPIYQGNFSFSTALTITQDLIRRHDLPQALVCANDQMALGVLLALDQAGMEVPEDVIVTGFDGIEATKAVRPHLTTVRQPMKDLGRAAVITIVKRIESPDAPPFSTELPATVLLRESSEGRIS